MALLSNIHYGLEPPPLATELSLVKGNYVYYHYKCDGFNDVGWGCGYRTLQTMCSWLIGQKQPGKVPSIPQIQEILVQLEDKNSKFKGSTDYIGSFEVCLVIDKLFDTPCKIVHIPSGNQLVNNFRKMEQHFKEMSSPLMMGGDEDAASKGILGTCSTDDNQFFLLVLDPHYSGKTGASATELQKRGYIKWISLNEFSVNSFYNLCFPQFSAVCTND